MISISLICVERTRDYSYFGGVQRDQNRAILLRLMRQEQQPQLVAYLERTKISDSDEEGRIRVDLVVASQKLSETLTPLVHSTQVL